MVSKIFYRGALASLFLALASGELSYGGHLRRFASPHTTLERRGKAKKSFRTHARKRAPVKRPSSASAVFVTWEEPLDLQDNVLFQASPKKPAKGTPYFQTLKSEISSLEKLMLGRAGTAMDTTISRDKLLDALMVREGDSESKYFLKKVQICQKKTEQPGISPKARASYLRILSQSLTKRIQEAHKARSLQPQRKESDEENNLLLLFLTKTKTSQGASILERILRNSNFIQKWISPEGVAFYMAKDQASSVKAKEKKENRDLGLAHNTFPKNAGFTLETGSNDLNLPKNAGFTLETGSNDLNLPKNVGFTLETGSNDLNLYKKFPIPRDILKGEELEKAMKYHWSALMEGSKQDKAKLESDLDIESQDSIKVIEAIEKAGSVLVYEGSPLIGKLLSLLAECQEGKDLIPEYTPHSRYYEKCMQEAYDIFKLPAVFIPTTIYLFAEEKAMLPPRLKNTLLYMKEIGRVEPAKLREYIDPIKDEMRTKGHEFVLEKFIEMSRANLKAAEKQCDALSRLLVHMGKKSI